MKRAAVIGLLLLACSVRAQDAGVWWGALAAGQATVSNSFPSSGLIAYWGMRTSGTNVLAEIGSVNGGSSGCLFGNEYGVNGPGAYFDGVNDFINVTGVSTTNQWTFAAWVKPLATTQEPKIFDAQTGRATFYFSTIYTLVWEFFDGSARHLCHGYLPDEWSHYVVTQQGALIRCYRNGVWVGSANGGGNSLGGTFILGARYTLDQTFFKGSMDEVAVWNRAISSNEAVRIYLENLVYP